MAGFDYYADTASVSSTIAETDTGGTYTNGYILNYGSVAVHVYVNLSVATAGKKIYIPAGAAVTLEKINVGALKSLSYVTASSTTNIAFNFWN